MKITISVYNILQLNKFLSYGDAFVLNFKGSSLVYEDLNIDEAIDICLKNNKLAIIAMNKMPHPKDISLFSEIIKKYKDLNVRFLMTEIGACNLAIKNNCVNKVIFDPQTMITNTLDLMEYKKLGFDACAMSLEIPFEDIIESKNQANARLFSLVFGHRMMFYSRRELISLYEEKANIKTTHHNLYLKESTRNDFFPIIENENGTMIYRSYLISLVPFFNELKDFEYVLFDPLYIDSFKFDKTLALFNDLNNNKITIEECCNAIDSLKLDIKDGFIYQDSVYQKELF